MTSEAFLLRHGTPVAPAVTMTIKEIVPDQAERIRATMEPQSEPMMTQSWHHLLFLHWKVSADQLRPMLPPGLDLDTHDGVAYVGLVPFTLTGVKPAMTPSLPFASHFHEVNVRTYVHAAGRDPGVWFFSLDASSALAVAGARALYQLPYFLSEIEWSAEEKNLPQIEFDSTRKWDGGSPANCHVGYKPIEGPVGPADPGTLEHFLIERYILYAYQESRLYRARVHHKPYPVQKAAVTRLEETLVWAAGIKRPEDIATAHYSTGVDVNVYGLEPLG